jgi:S-adenosylmethionine:tRNA ribosyltransferase-isomerase
MKLSHFRFDLPQELIAKYPAENRDDARLMVLDRKKQKIYHKTFKDIVDYFDDGDLFIMNNTKVFPARLFGRKEKTGANIEVFLLRELNKDDKLWDVLVDPARKIRIGNKLFFGENDELVAEVIDNTTSRGRTIKFLHDGSYDELKNTIQRLGQTPLPKLVRPTVEDVDTERYQNIYAKHEGAVAVPTAGMHFSKQLMKRMEIKGIEFTYVTLHAGLGNFRSIDVEDLTKHKMDSEEILISEEAVKIVNRAKERKNNVCAVGTTTMRTVESSVSISGMLKPFEGWTNKFVFPPHDFSIANTMISNFHLPQSTLMMMVAAFAGYDFLMKAYKEAIKEKYQFFTYGDAMLII